MTRGSSVSNFIDHEKTFQLWCQSCIDNLSSCLACGHTAHEFPPLPEEEEGEGDMNMVGPGRSSGFGHADEEPNFLGLHRTSGFSSFGWQSFSSQQVTPFHFEGKQGGLVSSRPINLVGNTGRMGHPEQISIILSPSGFAVFVNMSSVAFFVVSSVQRAPELNIHILVRNLESTN